MNSQGSASHSGLRVASVSLDDVCCPSSAVPRYPQPLHVSWRSPSLGLADEGTFLSLLRGAGCCGGANGRPTDLPSREGMVVPVSAAPAEEAADGQGAEGCVLPRCFSVAVRAC